MTFDPFNLETGVLSNYVGEVEEAWFTFDPKYNNGQSLIMRWKMKTDQPGELAEWTEGWPVGSEWKTVDGGKTAEHPKGEEKTFNQSSQFGKVIKEMVGLGAIDQLKAMGRRDPRKADMWVGTKWKFEQKVIQKNQATGEDVVRNVPTAFLGVTTSTTSQSAPPVTSAPTAASPTTPPVTSNTNGAVDPELVGLAHRPELIAAIKAAAKMQSHERWADTVLAMEGVAEQLQVVMALSDEGGLYARLRAS